MSAQDYKNHDMQKIQKILDADKRATITALISRLWELIITADELLLDDFRSKAQVREYELTDALRAANLTDLLDVRVFHYLRGTYRLRLCRRPSV